MHSLSYSKIIKIAWPMLLANMSVPLLGLVDTAILGHLDQAIYLGTAALGSQIIGLLFWSFGFLRMGTTGFTARAMGANNPTKIISTLQEACIFGGLIGFTLIATKQWTLPFAAEFLAKENPELAALTLEYASIRVWAAPAALITYALIGWLIGLQKTKDAMWVLVCTNVVNIVLDYILIIQLDMNSAGAAYASMVSEYIGLILALAFTYRHAKGFGGFQLKHIALNWAAYSDMFTSSRHLFIRTLCLLIVFLFFTSQGAALGENTLASNAILLNLLALTAYAMDGFAYAAETLCGHAWGSKNRQALVQVCIKTSVLAGTIALASCLLLVLGEPWIISLYTDLPKIRETASSGYLWLAFLPLLAIWCYQLDGIFVGIGQTSTMQNAMLAATILVYFPTWWLTREWDNTGLWVTLWVFHLARTVFLGIPFMAIVAKTTSTTTKP